MLAAYRYISDIFIGKLISGFLATSLLRADNQCSSKIRPHQEIFHWYAIADTLVFSWRKDSYFAQNKKQPID